jgi:SNF2 family DNA or RNA helicase
LNYDPRLHPYQLTAIGHLHGTGERGAGLFMDMGLGKTAVCLQALTPEHLPALVVAPLRVAREVWEVERDLWRPDLSMQVLADLGPTKELRQGERRRRLLQRPPTDVTVVSRGQVDVLYNRVHPYKTLIVDELSGYKTYGAVRSRNTRHVAFRTEHTWGLTGTPAPNGLLDLWHEVYLLDRGRRLGDTFGGYRQRYFEVTRRHKRTDEAIEWGPKPGAEQAIHDAVYDLCLSMKKEDYLPDLPELLVNPVNVTMTPDCKRAYRDMERDLVADLRLLGGGVHSAANAAALSMKLRQLTAGFIYADQDTTRFTRLMDAKTDALLEIWDGTSDNLLVFYQFVEEKDNLLRRLDGRGGRPRARFIDEPGAIKAWNRREVEVMVAHPRSAGHGLNLQHGGHTQVWTSLTWELEAWLQGIDRMHRQGQRDNVVAHVLCVPGTLDRHILRRLAAKEQTQDALLDYCREAGLFL